jgi:hypothetical protein
MERQRAPLVAEIERAKGVRRGIDAAVEPHRRLAELFGLEDSETAAPPVEPAPATEPVQTPAAAAEPERAKPPASTDSEITAGWARYERRDALAWLVERIREWWPPFEPGVVGHWVRLEREIKNLRHELGTDQRTHEEFDAARLLWSAEDLVAYMEKIRMIPKSKRGPRGPTTCERLRELHRQDPDFAETAGVRDLAKRIDRSPGALDGSHYYRTVLKPKRAEIEARKKAVNRPQKWGDFNSIGRPDEEPEDH